MTNEKILCVDDDPIVLFSFQRDLQARYPLVTSQNGEEALALLKDQGPFGVIVADMLMPGMNGIELLAQAQRLAPDTVRVMLTGDEERQTAVEAINEGRIFRFLSKPCPREKLIAALDASLEYYRLIMAERELLEQTLNGSVKMLTELLSNAEPDAFGRGQKIREYVRITAPALNLTQTWEIEVAAMLAQIGVMTIPPTVTEKQRLGIPLTDREKEMLARVPVIGYEVLSKIPRLEPAARIVLFQNKNADGTGFPTSTHKNVECPRGTKLLRILADFVDLESKGIGREAAFDQLRQRRGVYDAHFLESVSATFVSRGPTVKGSALTVKDLLPGQELLSDVKTLDGRLIAPTGTTISAMMLERFHNFAEISGIKEPIYVKNK